MTAILIESALRLSVVATAALLGAWLLRKKAAATRHALLGAAVVVAAAMPLLQRVVPTWGAPVAWSRIGVRLADVPALGPATTGDAARPAAESGSRSVPATPAGERPDLLRLVPAIWLGGVALVLLPLAIGIVRLLRLTASAEPVREAVWTGQTIVLTRRAGMQRPVTVRRVPDHRLLFAWGLLRPEIVVPGASREWSEDRVRIVLSHEVAHLARHDWPLQILAELLRAVYWFNPLVWLLARRLRAESERACDDAVLASGVSNTDYAAELLAIATELVDGEARWLPAPAMARASHLEGRVAAMLNPNLDRTPLSRSRRAVALVVASAIALAASGYAISAQSFASIAGSVSDQLGGLIPGATLVLVHQPTGNKYEVKSNSTGMFEFVGLPAGEYSLESSVPGFMSTQSTLVIGGGSVRRDIALELGSLQETIRVVGRRRVAELHAPATAGVAKVTVSGDGSFLEKIRERRPAAAQRQAAAVAACTPPVVGGLGGNIKVPVKIRNVSPVYPDSAEVAGIEGLVTLNATIGPDGTIHLVRVNSESSPAVLGAAALEAVGQWEFTPTLLNCRAVEVQMNVVVRFVLEP
jgi:TonB family protein